MGLYSGDEKVETSLNAEYVAEECRLQHHRLRVVFVHLLGQVVAYELLYVLFLLACVLIELLHRSLIVHVVARCQTYGVGLEEFHNALAEGHVAVVYRVVQETSCKITEMDVHRVGLRFQSVHHVHIWRLGVGFEARCNSRDVYQIVGFVNDEFGHAHILLHANAHEVELCVCRKYLFQISPVAFAAQRQITVLPSVANLKFRSVLFFRGVNVVVVPRTYDAAQQVYVEFAPTSLALLLGQQPVERLRYIRNSTHIAHQQSCRLDVVCQRLLQFFVAHAVHSVQLLARVVYQHSRFGRNAVLLRQIVELGKHADKVDAVVGNTLVYHAFEYVAQYGVFLAYGEVGCAHVFQLVIKRHGAVGGIGNILVSVIMFHSVCKGSANLR